MKAAKLLAAVPILALSASAIIAWSAFTRAETPSEIIGGTLSVPGSVESSRPLDPAEEARVSRMEARINLIASRLGMAAPMEKGFPYEERMIARNLADGTIVEVTLEEVEAAVAAAATTPDTQDDIAAERLKHCGSYRFFAPE